MQGLPVTMPYLKLLRWRFEFADKPAKSGVWNSAGTTLADKAYMVNKSGLVRALVQSKDIKTGLVNVVAECSGQEYVNFEWMAASKMNFAALQKSKNREMKLRPMVYGIKLVTDKFIVSATVDGNINVRHLKDE